MKLGPIFGRVIYIHVCKYKSQAEPWPANIGIYDFFFADTPGKYTRKEVNIMAEWERLAADKRARLEKTISAEWKLHSVPESGSYMDVPATSRLLSETELQITGSSATDLVAKLASGELKSVDVTVAFCKRAAIAHQLVCDLLFWSFLKSYQELKVCCCLGELRVGIFP